MVLPTRALPAHNGQVRPRGLKSAPPQWGRFVGLSLSLSLRTRAELETALIRSLSGLNTCRAAILSGTRLLNNTHNERPLGSLRLNRPPSGSQIGIRLLAKLFNGSPNFHWNPLRTTLAPFGAKNVGKARRRRPGSDLSRSSLNAQNQLLTAHIRPRRLDFKASRDRSLASHLSLLGLLLAEQEAPATSCPAARAAVSDGQPGGIESPERFGFH